jgi:DNA processing protein
MTLPALDDRELDATLAWLRAPRITAATLAAATAMAGSAHAALAAGASLWRAAGIDPGNDRFLAAPDRDAIASDRIWLADPRHHLVLAGTSGWPPQLDDLTDPPAGLWVVGQADALWLPQVAVVGARAASHAGREIAAEFAERLATVGLVVTSGLADGIDTAAHQATIAVGGVTIAVCGTGLDTVYPPRNAELATRIGARGAVVSEFALGRPPLPEHFPRRNRIIAALALGTVVIEAGLRSGSLITARLAAECGREVMAVPGSIRNPRAQGCHRLIRQGAALVESPDEVIELLAPALARLRATLDLQATPAEAPVDPTAGCSDPAAATLLDALGDDAAGIDLLVARTGLTAAAVSSMLQALELDGLVARLPGGLHVRNRRPSPRNAVSRGRG